MAAKKKSKLAEKFAKKKPAKGEKDFVKDKKKRVSARAKKQSY